MKKQILNLGKALNKVEQKSFWGGFGSVDENDRCFCLIQKGGQFYAHYVDCYSTCPDGSDPLQY
ncbi:hypothetical protein [Tenacibaculum caenipelagi]|uniref:Uncharacterized protein n=1 Tax=Tenacibaculum caenipelagi TaxID=1325435 RepID=A0A4R6TC49_9FLAO|nr:hypothetical protein [Tenacibaculum caenipelagi]TDQ23964.1 hypothetical protein DFQ07_2503 [Tenacibaculum caenipelagi]